MADQNTTTADAGNAPVFRLQKLYVKDFSFENPNAPEVFFFKETEPKVDMNLSLKNKKLDEQHWEVTLAVTAKVTDAKTEKTLFIIEIEHAGDLDGSEVEHIDEGWIDNRARMLGENDLANSLGPDIDRNMQVSAQG